MADTTKTAAAGNWKVFSTVAEEISVTTGNTAKKAGDTVTYNGVTYKLTEDLAASTTAVKTMAYKNLSASEVEAEKNKLATIDLTDPEVLRNLVEAGFIVFEKPMGDGTITEVNVATDTNLQETSDEVDLKKAEAKYEADMRKINQKDKKFDTDLAAMEAERNAIKTEMETLKSVAKDNVDRTYKLFS